MDTERKAKMKTHADVLAFVLKRGSVNLTQREIADILGYSASTINRSISFLKDIGIITVNENKIKFNGNKNIKRNASRHLYDALDIVYELLFNIMDNKSDIAFNDNDENELISKKINNTELIIRRENK
jgi:DNA-binding transcriptional regulator LsrR (DeoR family)